jgi:hypothetical protein
MEDERLWCAVQRRAAVECLADAGIKPGSIPDMPEWHLSPCLSLWLIEAGRGDRATGWWVICGELPSDLFPAIAVFGPRNAMHAFGMRWLEAVSCLERGEPHPVLRACPPDDAGGFAAMLRSRADFLVSWSEDDMCWDIDYAY